MTQPMASSAGYPQAAVCCIVYWPKEDAILLVKKADHKYDGGLWGCPGGKQEYSESSVTAAWRELGEECGAGMVGGAVEYVGLVAVVEDVIPVIRKHYVCNIHLFQVVEGCYPIATNAESQHHAAVGWAKVRAIPPNVTSAFRKVAEAVTRKIGPVLLPAALRDRPWMFDTKEA